MRSIKSLFMLVALGLALAVASPASAQFQSYQWNGTTAVGEIVYVINTTDSTIVDGSLVCLDTTSVVKRIGVRNYIPGGALRTRIVGIAVGEIKRSSQGGNGRMLKSGYHPSALIGASNVAAGDKIKFGTISGSFAIADTVSSIVGYVLGGNSGTVTGPRYTYKVWFYGGNKIGGATL